MFGLGTKKETPLEEGKYAKGKSYLYIKGEKFNSMVQIESYKAPYVNFSDGSRITHELFDEYLVEPETADADFNIDSLKKSPSDLRNQHTVQNLENKSVINLSSNIPIVEEKKQVADYSPVTLILQKQIPEEVQFEVTLKVRVPDKNLIPVLNSSFGEENTTRDLYAYVFSQIDYAEFKDDIQLAVQKYYNLKSTKETKKQKNEKGKGDNI